MAQLLLSGTAMKDSAANSLILARPERLLRGLRPLVLRFAPDSRRALRGSVQSGADAGLSNSACCLPGVRITTANCPDRQRGFRQGIILWRARRDSNSRPPGS